MSTSYSAHVLKRAAYVDIMEFATLRDPAMLQKFDFMILSRIIRTTRL